MSLGEKLKNIFYNGLVCVIAFIITGILTSIGFTISEIGISVLLVAIMGLFYALTLCLFCYGGTIIGKIFFVITMIITIALTIIFMYVPIGSFLNKNASLSILGISKVILCVGPWISLFLLFLNHDEVSDNYFIFSIIASGISLGLGIVGIIIFKSAESIKTYSIILGVIAILVTIFIWIKRQFPFFKNDLDRDHFSSGYSGGSTGNHNNNSTGFSNSDVSNALDILCSNCSDKITLSDGWIKYEVEWGGKGSNVCFYVTYKASEYLNRTSIPKTILEIIDQKHSDLKYKLRNAVSQLSKDYGISLSSSFEKRIN